MSLIGVCSAEIVANTEDLLIQIIDSLPPPSLYRFRCVSKHWLSLIAELKRPKLSGFFSGKDGFQFIPLIGNHEISSSSNLFKTLNKEIIPTDLSQNPQLDILQSCNGLFLCHVTFKHRYYTRTPVREIYVVNPTTNQLLVRNPPSFPEYGMMRCVLYGLAFDPSKSPYYKVVFVYADHMISGHQIDIYSSRTGHWESLTPGYMQLDFRIRQGPVYCNGAIHWIIKGGRDLLYFDIDQERLQLAVTRRRPTTTTTTRPTLLHRYFGESGGYLYLIDIYERSSVQFEVMQMEKDYSHWVVRYFVDLNPVIAALPQHDSNDFVVLNLSRESERVRDNHQEEDSASLLLHMPDRVISYNCRNKSFKTCVELKNKKVVTLSEYNYPYMKSLASV